MPASAAVYGCQGPELAPEERDFFRDARPFGFILFARNVEHSGASRCVVRPIARLDRQCERTDPYRSGGRARSARSSRRIGRIARPRGASASCSTGHPDQGREAAYLCARLIAHDLRSVGVTVNCAPVLDVPVQGAHDIIGDRAYSLDPATVIELGRATIDGYLDGGVLPVIKHMPGHGRAMRGQPFGAAARDRAARTSSARTTSSLSEASTRRLCAMTAHVVFEAIDPRRPATTSPKVIRSIIRGEIGFDGLLVSDDLSMSALEGPLSARTKAALFAGCDIALHCNGKRDEMMDVAREAKELAGEALDRADAALCSLARTCAAGCRRGRGALA